MPGLTLQQPQEIQARLGFLADLPRYKNEKPRAYVHPAVKPSTGVNHPIIQKDVREDMRVENVRGWKSLLSIEEQGFQVLDHASQYTALDTKEVCEAYKTENQKLIKDFLGAEEVITWSLRKRTPKKRVAGEVWDYWNELEVEQPAILAHCDFTYERGLVRVEKFLGKEATQKYIDDGYRIRIVNTWRPLVDVIERQPLAFCDPRSVKKEDLIECERVLIDDVAEITLLQHRPEQKWYCLDGQTDSELFIFPTWDSTEPDTPDVVRHCPHVAMEPNNVREDAPPRYSVESRSVVVTRM